MYFTEPIDVNNFQNQIFFYRRRELVHNNVDLDTTAQKFGGTISSAVFQNV